MKIILFTIIVLPLFLQAQDFGEVLTSGPNPNELIIDQFECVGNATTNCDLIQKEIYLEVGDKVNEDELSNAKIRLQLRNLFKSVNLYLKKGSKRGNVKVVIEVEESSAVYTEMTIQTESHESSKSTRDSLFLTVGHRNLFGLGKVLQVTAELVKGEFDNKSKNFKLDYTDPNLFGSKKLYLNLNFSKNYDSIGECYDCARKNEETTYQGTLGYRIFDFSYISLSSERNRYESIYESPQEQKYTFESQTEKFSYGWNSEDDSYFPTQGEKFSVGFSKLRFFDMFMPTRTYGYDTNYRHNWLASKSNLFVFKFNFNQQDSGNSSAPSRWYSVPFQYAYIFSPNLKSGVLRSRAFLEVSPNFFELPVNNDEVQYAKSLLTSVGYTMEHRSLGILRLYLGYWSSL
ncbi:MAG: hypothetical protein B7Y39_06765 [Bdellovibrio sp. 28-41-41]|nr:MAG: hypothetical protein B7Y39_06765 [Bdellovibrio sp. 28-41-41]